MEVREKRLAEDTPGSEGLEGFAVAGLDMAGCWATEGYRMILEFEWRHQLNMQTFSTFSNAPKKSTPF